MPQRTGGCYTPCRNQTKLTNQGVGGSGQQGRNAAGVSRQPTRRCALKSTCCAQPPTPASVVRPRNHRAKGGTYAAYARAAPRRKMFTRGTTNMHNGMAVAVAYNGGGETNRTRAWWG